MTWSDISETLIGAGLPLLGGAIAGPAGNTVGGMIATALGCPPKPEVVATKCKDPSSLTRLRMLQERNRAKLEELQITAEIASINQVNMTYRTEIASNDPYIRRMRPTCGYLIILILLMFATLGSYAVLFDRTAISDYTDFVNAMNNPLMVALGVLGVYVKKRSDEKMIKQQPNKGGGLLGAFLRNKK